ncbi:hypothetical protein TUM17576_53180 [Enterobacter hormaechei]|uniref:OmpA family protein n=1 Tax=Phytobacter ursingii TaxID=1972431 RepID=A0AB35RNY3_9ENTR|nr:MULTISPECIES: OmpA family protein [Enterobacteriaceae]MDV2861752.1 OmpA family protein [Phytobacter ursingii]GJL38498.1 hypothetical protein TUM17576_53180 [Enterobacter hormaechei]
MKNTHKQAVLLWGVLLLLILWAIFSPASAAVKYSLVAVVVIGVAIVWLFWRQKTLPKQADDAWLASLPAENYQQPVVLVCGDGATPLFSDRSLRQVLAGLYLHVADEEQLVSLTESLLSQRPAWGAQLCVARVVIPGQHQDAAVMAEQLQRFSRNLMRLRRRVGAKVPLILWSYQTAPATEEPSPWFICAGCDVQVVTDDGESEPAEWIAQASMPACSQRLGQMLLAANLLRWLNQIVMPALDREESACLPLVLGAGFASSLPEKNGNVWQQWITDKTCLMPEVSRHTSASYALSFPDAILPLLPRQSGPGPVRRAWATALAMATIAGIIALCLSAMANRSLLRQVSDDLHKYAITPMADTVVKSRYLSVLKEDAQRLDDYYREGEPLRLGLGLYPGERLRQPVLQAIRAYRPPESKTESVPGGAVQTVRLDSMALFDVGQARLKIGSTKVLVEALVNIKAKPGWLILVAGYTDSTGDEKSNQQLSLRRAEAVRDWMLQTSDIPFTCFAVQGLGESQPAATNDTPEGRATNRRVEISLVPRSDACQDVKQQIPPELAVSQFNQQGE